MMPSAAKLCSTFASMSSVSSFSEGSRAPSLSALSTAKVNCQRAKHPHRGISQREDHGKKDVSVQRPWESNEAHVAVVSPEAVYYHDEDALFASEPRERVPYLFGDGVWRDVGVW